MFGHRPDGKRLRDVDPIVQITPYLMPMRCDAQVFLEHKLDYEMLARYIARKNRKGSGSPSCRSSSPPMCGV